MKKEVRGFCLELSYSAFSFFLQAKTGFYFSSVWTMTQGLEFNGLLVESCFFYYSYAGCHWP